jgi:hypothetical protein
MDKLVCTLLVAAMLVPDERDHGAFRSLVGPPMVDLAQRLGIDPEAVTVEEIEESQFPDAGLGVPEPNCVIILLTTPAVAPVSKCGARLP